MHRTVRTVVAAAVAALLLGACAEAVPAGHHRMPDGTLMQDAAPAAVPDGAEGTSGTHEAHTQHDEPGDAGGAGAEDHARHGDAGDDGAGPAPGTEFVALGASGTTVAVHRSAATGELLLGSAPAPGHGEHAGHGGHAAADPADFPSGVVPSRLRIPALGVDVPVEVGSVATIEGSEDPSAVTWSQDSRRPGEIGPAVIGGGSMPAGVPTALADLAALVAGDALVVVGEDGDEVSFVVAEVRTVPVSERSSIFAVVAGQSPELRLVLRAVQAGGDDLVVRAVLGD